MNTRESAVTIPPPHEWLVCWDQPRFQDHKLNKIDLCSIFPLPTNHLCNRTWLSAREYYNWLIFMKAISKHCLNLEQGRLIAAHGDAYQILGECRIYLWQSVAGQVNIDEDRSGHEHCFVPYVQILPRQAPIIYWLWMEYNIVPEEALGYIP